MKTVINKALRFATLAALIAAPLFAQDIAGDWQGTLTAGAGHLRIVVRFAKEADGAWKGTLFSIDQGTEGIPMSSVTVDGSSLRLAIPQLRGNYEGKVSADGASINGTWTQAAPLPLELRRATKETAWPIDPSPHTVQFITVDKDVKLEVLDWGGSGRPLVLLTGLGNNAHIFDKFAPKLTGACHVYGITRRGYGASSAPASGYSADRLGDDVLAVIDSLKLMKPVLAGHSIAGEELSSIGSRHPEKVAGLIYLDAGYGYALYDSVHGYLQIDLQDLQDQLALMQDGKGPNDTRPIIHELLRKGLPRIEQDLRTENAFLDSLPASMLTGSSSRPIPASSAILGGEQKYSHVDAPALAIFAVPHDMGPEINNDPAAREKFDATDKVSTGAQAEAFAKAMPDARVVRIPHANHFVFISNEADVLREMNAFIAGLK